MASTAVSMLPNAVMTITGVRKSWLRRCCSNSKPADAGQTQIGDDHVGAIGQLQRVFGRAGLLHFIARGLQLQLDHPAQFLFVFDNQDRGFHELPFSRTGRNTRNTLPAPGSLSTVISSAVLVHDFRHDRQTQPYATRLGGEERIEDAFPILGSDAGAAIDHVDFHCIARPGAS